MISARLVSRGAIWAAALTVVIIFGCCMTAGAVMPGYGVTVKERPAKESIDLKVKNIDWRKDLTRVYCTITGIPHTSHRFDAITLTPQGGRPQKAIDIDGIDMKRYFQMEDEGTIDLEIDFPPMKQERRMTLTITGVGGVFSYNIVRK